MKKIVLSDVYSVESLKNQIPFYAEDCFHVKIETYGFLHDVGTEIILDPIKDGELPRGWDTLEDDLEKASAHCAECWEMANNFAYH